MIYDSRILTTRHIAASLEKGAEVVLCSTSAVGYYGTRGDDLLVETDPPGSDFLARVGIDWEKEALAAQEKGIRVVTPRFGVILGNGGGALAKMIPAFKSFAGGPVGTGRQWFPWIHMDDLVSAVRFCVDNASVSGPVNLTAPNPVRNRDLAAALGKALNRPAVMAVPAFMIRLSMGEMGSVLLASQRVVPDKLTRNGFVFKYPAMENALADLVH
jgi:uncharacterized protein (TIGR01777 family)